MNILRYFRRRRRQLQKREYLFAGVVWVHKSADFEQAAKVGQVIYRLIETTECGDIPLNEFLGTVLDAGGMADMLEILLIPSTPPQNQVDFRRFPAEDAWEVVTDFFTWNKNSGKTILYSAAAMMGIKLGTNGKVPTPGKDAAS